MRWTMRALILGTLGACAVGALLAVCTVMPGRSFSGVPPPLHEREQAVALRLRGHVTALAESIGERNWSHYDGLERARTYVAGRLEEAGYGVRVLPYEHRGETFHNVEASLAGAGRGPIVVVGAHYDSIEGSPGANDNASGVAAMIELARWLRPDGLPAVRFVAFANEEPPYFHTGEGMGSVAYVRSLGRATERVTCMLSLEALGYYRDEPGTQHYPPGIGLLYPDRGDFVAFVANTRSLGILRRVMVSFRAAATIASEGAALPAVVPGVDWSDHRSFWDVGVRALMVTDTAVFRDPEYHRAGDTPERLDFDRLARVVEALVAVLRDLGRDAG